jgi:hypothetical protein
VRILNLDDASLKKVELWPAFMEMQQTVVFPFVAVDRESET